MYMQQNFCLLPMHAPTQLSVLGMLGLEVSSQLHIKFWLHHIEENYGHRVTLTEKAVNKEKILLPFVTLGNDVSGTVWLMCKSPHVQVGLWFGLWKSGQTTTQPAQPLAIYSIIDISQLYIEAVTITELQVLGTFFISLVPRSPSTLHVVYTCVYMHISWSYNFTCSFIHFAI